MGGKRKAGKKTKKKDAEVNDEVEYLGSVGQDTEQEPTQVKPTVQEPEVSEDEGINKEGNIEEEPEGELHYSEGHDCPIQPKLKKQCGPTRMKNIAKDPNSREQVEFTDMGEPCGPGSVKLASYIGALVREHVPVIIDDWRKISVEMKTVPWKSVQARFAMDEEYQKIGVLKHMGCLWRSSKSRLVDRISNKAKTNQERINLRPKNVTPTE